MALQSALAQVGIAKQSAKGSAASNPTFAHGVTSGTVLTVDVSQELEEHTSGSRMSGGVNRTGVMPGMDFACRAHAKTLGLYLYGALGSVATTGAGPYTHTFTTANALPYMTAFGKMGSNIYAVEDFKVDEIAISFEETMPLEVSVSGMGTVANYAGTFTAGTDDTAASYFVASKGTFKIDVDSDTPVTAAVRAGEINIMNSLESIMLAGSISPSDISEGRQEIECSFDIVPDDLAMWRTIATGTSSGTSAAVDPVYGSFEIAFTNGTDTLTLTASKVAFTCDFPDADPAGGAVSITLEGLVVKPAGAALTAVLVNGTSTY